MEQWELIEFGQGRYSVSSYGVVKNNTTNQIMKTQIQNSGYEILCLNFNGTRKAFTVHRLVAIAFLDHVKGKLLVDHIDSNKKNNYATNLRWVTPHENMRHAVKNGCLKNAAKKAAKRMVAVGSKYGFANSQKYLKTAKPITLFIDDALVNFRSERQASMYLKIDHKTLTNRVKRGYYQSGIDA